MRALSMSVFSSLLILSAAPSSEARSVQLSLSATAEVQAPLATRPMLQRRFDFEDPATGVVTFAWEQSAGAALYQLQLSAKKDYSELKNPAHQFVLGADSTRVEVTGLSEGGYYWRVAAIDSQGKRSNWSNSRAFSVNEGPPPAAGEGPKLQITSSVPAGIKCIIRGTTSADGRLEAWVNGVPAGDIPIGFDGEFSVMLDANQIGKNKVRLIAIDRSGATAIAETSFPYNGN